MKSSRRRLSLAPCRLVAVSLLSLLPSPVSAAALEVKDGKGLSLFGYAESHALVIWAGDYRNPFWKKLNNLREEASQVAEALAKQGFNVSVVANPTGKELMAAIDQFVKRYGYKPDSRLVIYYAGHGWTRKNNFGYLVPIDAPDASTIDGDLDFAKRALSMEQILSWSRQMEAKHVLFVFDSCFSGAIFKVRGASHPPAYLERKIGLPVRQFITAGDANEVVPAKSIFTPLLIRGLSGEADINRDGYITGSELGDYLPQAMANYSSAQNPQYGKIRDPDLDLGDIVFRSTTTTTTTTSSSSSSSPSSSSPPAPTATAPSQPLQPRPALAPQPPAQALLPPPSSASFSPLPSAKPAASGDLLMVSAESIIGPSAAVAQARERIPPGGTERRNHCVVVAVAGTDRHRCTIWYSPALPSGPIAP